MSLNGMLVSNDLGTGDYVVTRTAAGTMTLGRYTSGAVTTFTTNLGIEPASGRQLRDLPEGRRGDETISIFSPVELKTTMPGSEPDQILYRGEQWAVVTSKQWEGFGEIHWECLAQRAPSPAGVVP
jgi:hypothetical protein